MSALSLLGENIRHSLKPHYNKKKTSLLIMGSLSAYHRTLDTIKLMFGHLQYIFSCSSWVIQNISPYDYPRVQMIHFLVFILEHKANSFYPS